MATIVERQAGTGPEKDRRRLYIVFWATDRKTGKKRKVWELQASTLKNDAKDHKRRGRRRYATPAASGLPRRRRRSR